MCCVMCCLLQTAISSQYMGHWIAEEVLCYIRDGHGYPNIDQGPSLGGFAKSEDGSVETDLFGSDGDDEVELEKSNVLLLGPTGVCFSTK